MGQEGAPSLLPQAETLLFQIPSQNIQKGYNTQEAQQEQRTSSLCCLNIWKVPQEVMEYKRQTLKQINQESLGDQNQGHKLN